jgi:hypothetical protein
MINQLIKLLKMIHTIKIVASRLNYIRLKNIIKYYFIQQTKIRLVKTFMFFLILHN